jgi:hypothetical protein
MRNKRIEHVLFAHIRLYLFWTEYRGAPYNVTESVAAQGLINWSKSLLKNLVSRVVS